MKIQNRSEISSLASREARHRSEQAALTNRSVQIKSEELRVLEHSWATSDLPEPGQDLTDSERRAMEVSRTPLSLHHLLFSLSLSLSFDLADELSVFLFYAGFSRGSGTRSSKAAATRRRSPSPHSDSRGSKIKFRHRSPSPPFCWSRDQQEDEGFRSSQQIVAFAWYIRSLLSF